MFSKVFLILISVTSFSFHAFAKDPADISGCKGAAVKAAIDYASNQYSTRIKYDDGSVVSVQKLTKGLLTKYAIGLEQCDGHGCGSLSFDVYVVGKKPNCDVREVELTGEE